MGQATSAAKLEGHSGDRQVELIEDRIFPSFVGAGFTNILGFSLIS